MEIKEWEEEEMTIPLSNKVEDIFAGIKEISNVDAAEILSLHKKNKLPYLTDDFLAKAKNEGRE